MTSPEVSSTSGNRGVVRWAARYDLLLTLITLGRESALRERLLDLARLAAGESVLDVGCGTGTLTIAAKRRVGPNVVVRGIDASAEMIARAAKKARRAKADVTFETAFVESLPLPDAQFDVVLSTVMLHHLRRAVREQSVGEMHRVLKPGGRLLVVDLMSHDRIEYVVQLGHVWQGFDGEQVKEWLEHAGFTACRYRPLPADPEAKGPALFAASGRKK